MRTISALFVLTLLAACEPGRPSSSSRSVPDDLESTDLMAKTVEDDVEELTAALTKSLVPAATLDDQAEGQASECYATWGECAFCYEVEGNALSGEFVAGIETSPCTESWTGPQSSAVVTVSSFTIEGSWDEVGDTVLPQGDDLVVATGSRASTVEVDGPNSDPASFDSALSFYGEVTSDDYELATIALDLSYASFADHSWTVHVEGTAGSITGSVQRDDGVVCSLTGSVEDVDVSCE